MLKQELEKALAADTSSKQDLSLIEPCHGFCKGLTDLLGFWVSRGMLKVVRIRVLLEFSFFRSCACRVLESLFVGEGFQSKDGFDFEPATLATGFIRSSLGLMACRVSV